MAQVLDEVSGVSDHTRPVCPVDQQLANFGPHQRHHILSAAGPQRGAHHSTCNTSTAMSESESLGPFQCFANCEKDGMTDTRNFNKA